MTVDLASVLLRALGFVALLQAMGSALFLLLFGRTIAISASRIRSLTLGSALTAVALVSVHYALEAARLTGTWQGIVDPAMQSLVWESPARIAWIERVLGALLLGLASRVEHALSVLTTVAGVLLIAISFTAVGHTALPSVPGWLPLLLITHITIAAFWFGSLVPLLWVTRDEQADRSALIVENFSRRAVWLVPGLFIAGVSMAWNLVPSWSDLARPYGMLVLVKLAGFAVLMIFATMNLRRHGPALVRNSAAGESFRRSVTAEFVIMVLVLFATAVLTTFYSPDS